MSGTVEGSPFKPYQAYVDSAIEAAQRGDLQDAAKALYQKRPQEEIDHACEIVAGVFANSLSSDHPEGIKMYQAIKVEILALQRRERGIPNVPDADLRELAVQSAKAHRCGLASFLAEQIQDPSLKQVTMRKILNEIKDMSSSDLYDQDQKEIDYACKIAAGVFTNNLSSDHPERIKIYKAIKAEILALQRRERGIPNVPDADLRELAVQSAKAHRSGAASFCAEQIQDPSIKQTTMREIVDVISNKGTDMSSSNAYDQMKAFLLGDDDWEKKEMENLKHM